MVGTPQGGQQSLCKVSVLLIGGLPSEEEPMCQVTEQTGAAESMPAQEEGNQSQEPITGQDVAPQEGSQDAVHAARDPKLLAAVRLGFYSAYLTPEKVANALLDLTKIQCATARCHRGVWDAYRHDKRGLQGESGNRAKRKSLSSGGALPTRHCHIARPVLSFLVGNWISSGALLPGIQVRQESGGPSIPSG